MIVIFLALLAFGDLSDWKSSQCGGATVVGRYTNLSRGFSVSIPQRFQGRRGTAAEGNSATGNETPMRREFRSQPPNCGAALTRSVG
jgi:hypothetical protein